MAGTGSSAGNSGIPDVQPFGEDEDVRILEQGADEDGDNQDDTSDEGDDADEKDLEDIGKGEADEEDEEGEKEEEDQEEEGKEGEEDKDDKPTEDVAGRPTLRAIKEKYPDIFKNFPDLRAVIFRESKFAEHFGTVEEAAEAATKSRSFDIISDSLTDGSPELLLNELKVNNPEALAQVVENFLPQVEQISKDLYLKATVPIVEDLLWKVVAAAERSGDKNLKFSAQHINRFLFGDHNVREPKPREEAKPHPAEQKLAQERQNWQRERFKEAQSTFVGNVERRLEAAIVQGLDPNNALRPYLRKSLIKDINEKVNEALATDPAHVRHMESLWRKAANAGFPKDQIASIESAFLARAKQLVPGIRNKLRAEALGREQRPAQQPEKGRPTDKKRSIPAGAQARGTGNHQPAPKDIDYSRTTDDDILNDRVTLRRR